MNQMKEAYNITELCNVFDLPSSSYYYKPVDITQKNATIVAKIKEISPLKVLETTTSNFKRLFKM